MKERGRMRESEGERETERERERERDQEGKAERGTEETDRERETKREREEEEEEEEEEERKKAGSLTFSVLLECSRMGSQGTHVRRGAGLWWIQVEQQTKRQCLRTFVCVIGEGLAAMTTSIVQDLPFFLRRLRLWTLLIYYCHFKRPGKIFVTGCPLGQQMLFLIDHSTPVFL